MAAPLKDRSLLALVAPLLVSSLAVATACGDTDSGGGELAVPTRYEFSSRFEGADSVSYAGQTFRQVLITSMKREFSTIQEEIDNGGGGLVRRSDGVVREAGEHGPVHRRIAGDGRV